MTKYYKALSKDMKSFYDDKTIWELGKAQPFVANNDGNSACGSGYHLALTPEHAIEYARFPFRLFAAKPCGPVYGQDNTKIRVASASITKEIRRPLWALRTERFIESIKAVRWFSANRAPRKGWRMFETANAAWKAAMRAAWCAAWDAAWNAAMRTALDAVRDAARDAAWSAARDAAWDAAWSAARDAARSAARGEAWCAARDAARGAVLASARGDSRDVAWGAASDASLMASIDLVRDLGIDRKHIKYARERWSVWQSGYGLLCDLNGELYCYRKP